MRKRTIWFLIALGIPGGLVAGALLSSNVLERNNDASRVSRAWVGGQTTRDEQSLQV